MTELKSKFPIAIDPKKVGKYPALVKRGGGCFYDEVLEYRVWICLGRGSDTYKAFATYEEAEEFSKKNKPKAESPLVLVIQKEHINEPRTGIFEHIKEFRLTEWAVEWLDKEHKRNLNSIDEFLKKRA